MKAVPMARQNCAGSSRQVAVGRFPKGDKLACTHCSLKLVAQRTIYGNDLDPETGEQRLYMVLPPHIGVGHRTPDKIDWSAV